MQLLKPVVAEGADPQSGPLDSTSSSISPDWDLYTTPEKTSPWNTYTHSTIQYFLIPVNSGCNERHRKVMNDIYLKKWLLYTPNTCFITSYKTHSSLFTIVNKCISVMLSMSMSWSIFAGEPCPSECLPRSRESRWPTASPFSTAGCRERGGSDPTVTGIRGMSLGNRLWPPW